MGDRSVCVGGGGGSSDGGTGLRRLAERGLKSTGGGRRTMKAGRGGEGGSHFKIKNRTSPHEIVTAKQFW